MATPAHPALEGSLCNKDGRHCYQGQCLTRSNKPVVNRLLNGNGKRTASDKRRSASSVHRNVGNAQRSRSRKRTQTRRGYARYRKSRAPSIASDTEIQQQAKPTAKSTISVVGTDNNTVTKTGKDSDTKSAVRRSPLMEKIRSSVSYLTSGAAYLFDKATGWLG